MTGISNIKLDELTFDQLAQLREACETKMQELRERAKTDLLDLAARMGLDLSDLASGTKKKRRPRGHGKDDAHAEAHTVGTTGAITSSGEA